MINRSWRRPSTARVTDLGRTVLIAHPSAEMYGSDRVLLESVSALVTSGWRVVVTVPTDGPLTKQINLRGATVEFCLTPVLRKSLLRPAGIVRLARELFADARRGITLIRRERPAVIYVNTLTIPLWLVLAKIRRIPVLCHVHEGESSATWLVRAILAFPLLLADRVVANSKFSADVLARSFPRLRRRTQVVYNGVPGPSAVRKARTSLVSTLRVVYLGRLSPRKGVDVAVSAIAILKTRGVDVRLDVFGAVFPGYEWYERDLEELVEHEGLKDDVKLHGFLDSVWEGVDGADVVVVPSRVDEPFGNTAVEAVLAARPVIVSATSGLLEATSGFESAQRIPPSNPVALADALDSVIRNWTSLRVNAWSDVDIANARHAPEVYGQQIASIVGSLPLRSI